MPSLPILSSDPVVSALLGRAAVDPAEGLQIIGLDRLVARPFDAGMALLILPLADRLPPVGDADAPQTDDAAPQQGDDADAPQADHAGSQVDDTDAKPAHGAFARRADGAFALLPGRHGHGDDPAALLRRLYPAAHPILSAAGDTTVGEVEAAALAAAPHLLPPLEPAANPAGAFGLAWLVHRLRQSDGCPWDREQDHRTLKPFLLEETYEVYDALDEGSTPELAEELGDLLLQIVLHAQYAAEAGVFDLSDVQRGITAKIISRHPHVFGDVQADSAAEVMRNWEQIKADERAAIGDSRVRDPEMPAAFKGLSRSLPALAYADEMQGRAASLGYDWPDLEGVIDKIAEEATELLAATTDDERREEFGDLLFVLVNMGRKLGVDPEAALRSASRKFASRFARVERLADEQGLQLKALGLDALDDLWQLAKREEIIAKEAS